MNNPAFEILDLFAKQHTPAALGTDEFMAEYKRLRAILDPPFEPYRVGTPLTEGELEELRKAPDGTAIRIDNAEAIRMDWPEQREQISLTNIDPGHDVAPNRND